MNFVIGNFYTVTKFYGETLIFTSFSLPELNGSAEQHFQFDLGSCDRASWVKYEERETNKMQQLDVYY